MTIVEIDAAADEVAGWHSGQMPILNSIPSRRLRRGLYLAIVALALLPVALARFPPLYDYYNWILEGSVVARLLPWGVASGDMAVALAYTLRPVPVPNLGASVGIGLLDGFFGPVDAGRFLVALCVLTYGLGFAYLVRAFQGRATAVELLGFPWAYGYLMYKGYLSCQLAMGIAFLTIGKLYGIAGPLGKRLRVRDLVLLTVLGAGAYLTSLFGWLVVALAVVVFSLQLLTQGRRREGFQLTMTLAPSLLMLAWYAASDVGSAEIALYETWSAKATSLASALMLYMRTDPFPPPFPLLAVNLLGWSSLFVIVLVNLAPRGSRRVERSALWLGMLLAGIGVLLPLNDLGDAARPDERLILPGLLILVAALRFRPFTAKRGGAAAAVVSLLLLLHAAEYRRASGYLEEIRASTERLIAPGTSVYSLTSWESRRRGACGPGSGGDLSLGAPTLKWFDYVRLVEGGSYDSNMMTTSLVQRRRDYRGHADHWVRLVSLSENKNNRRMLRWEARAFEVVEVFGCPEALAAVRELLAPNYALKFEGEWFAILRRQGRLPSHRGRTGHRGSPSRSD